MTNRKKADYGKQRRNTYGEAPHAARKSIPRAKQRRNQSERRQARVELFRADGDAAQDAALNARIRGFRKTTDEPLGRVLMRRTVRQFIKGKISAATFRRKLKPLRARYPNFVIEYRARCHGYSHVALADDVVTILGEFK